jgi:uncharacterized RDD family membrane protein YckC
MALADPTAATPGLGRRLAALVYEGLLLFGVLMLAGWLYGGLTQQRHALEGRLGLQAFLFLVLAVYFVWFWTHGGQTVALKAWRMKVIAANGQPLTQGRALARYALSWLWFLPSLAAVQLAGLHSGAAIATTLAAGALTYAATIYLHPQRQYLHDVLCGTRIVDVAPHDRPLSG